MRPRNGPPEAVSTSRSTVPGALAADQLVQRGVLGVDRDRPARRVASASAVTSSPPTTSDSLLASATSMPSLSATIVGPSPAEPTMRVEHEVRARTRSTRPHEPLRARPAPRRRSGLARLGRAASASVGQRDPRARRAARACSYQRRLVAAPR